MNAQSLEYGFIHDGRVFTPCAQPDVPVAGLEERNRAIERAELALWAECPARFVAYYRLPSDIGPRPYRKAFVPSVVGATVATWLGTGLGQVVKARVYSHNRGGRSISLRVQGTNGAAYHGRASYDNGTVVRLHKAKV